MSHRKGFTLIELLIVIGILAILATAVILYLDPAQILAESRDTQRLADLASVIHAINITQNTDPTADFSATNQGPNCTANAAGTYCNPFVGGDCQTITTPITCTYNNSRAINGTGWVGFNFTGLGSNPTPAISTLPIDPVNTGCILDVSNAPAPTLGSSCYAFKYNNTDKTFELDAILESIKYKTTQAKMQNDGGNNPNFYEVGTNTGL